MLLAHVVRCYLKLIIDDARLLNLWSGERIDSERTTHAFKKLIKIFQ